jgi:hypothetical protein
MQIEVSPSMGTQTVDKTDNGVLVVDIYTMCLQGLLGINDPDFGKFGKGEWILEFSRALVPSLTDEPYGVRLVFQRRRSYERATTANRGNTQA